MQWKASRNQLSLLHGTKTKPEMLKKMVSSQSAFCQSARKREDLRWEGFVKEVGFELGVKEWRSYGWREWWIYGKSWTGMCRNIRVQDGETSMNNNNCFMALHLGLPGWAGTRRNIHQLTPLLITNHPLSAFSIYYNTWHLPCSIYMLDSLFAHISPSPLWSTSWSGTLHFILHTFLHPIIVVYSQHTPIPLQPVML